MLESLDEGSDSGRFEERICVYHDDDLTTRMIDTIVDSDTLSCIGLLEDMYILSRGISISTHFIGLIRRAIIDHDNLEVRIVRQFEAFDRANDDFLFIVCWDNDADAWGIWLDFFSIFLLVYPSPCECNNDEKPKNTESQSTCGDEENHSKKQRKSIEKNRISENEQGFILGCLGHDIGA